MTSTGAERLSDGRTLGIDIRANGRLVGARFSALSRVRFNDGSATTTRQAAVGAGAPVSSSWYDRILQKNCRLVKELNPEIVGLFRNQ
jgi:hypothetical protein